MKIFAFSLSYSHFLAASLGITSFFHNSIFEAAYSFTAGCFGLDTVYNHLTKLEKISPALLHLPIEGVTTFLE